MSTAKKNRTTLKSNTATFGLVANGSSGLWEIAIDEVMSGPDRWRAQIEGPSVAFCFEIPSVDFVGKMIQFLEPRRVATKESSNGSMERNDSLAIGTVKKTPITLVKDDEYEDRFFLLVGPTESPIVRYVIAGADVVKITEALRQVKEDLDED